MLPLASWSPHESMSTMAAQGAPKRQGAQGIMAKQCSPLVPPNVEGLEPRGTSGRGRMYVLHSSLRSIQASPASPLCPPRQVNVLHAVTCVKCANLVHHTSPQEGCRS